MELKNIFKMTKTDRYTQDGRDELAKLQETEDVKYKTGDISQKTGLQKQPDGSWAPPKGGGAAPKMGSPEYNEKYGLTKRDVATGKEVDRIYEKQQNRIKELKAKGYTDEQIENDKIYQQTKEDMRNVGKSKLAEGWTETRMASGKLYDLKSQGKRIIEQYDPETETKTFKLRDLNNSRAPDKEFKTLEEAKAAAGSTEEKPAENEISSSDIAIKLDEIASSKGGTKNIGGVKVTYVPGNGYRVTHKAPSGTEITTGYDSIEEAHQAVKFRLNRIKKGEIPAISEDAAPRILTGDTKIRIRK